MHKMKMQCLRYDLWGIRYFDRFLHEEEISKVFK